MVEQPYVGRLLAVRWSTVGQQSVVGSCSSQLPIVGTVTRFYLISQARSKAKTTGGAEQTVKQNYTPPLITQKTDRLGSLRCNKNVKKAVDLVSKTITLPASITLFGTSLCCFFYADYHVKFEGGRK